MITIDTSIFRDPGYLQRLETIQQRLAKIEADGSFIAYASNREVLDELEELIQENKERYQKDYLSNVKAFKTLKDEIIRQKPNVHPAQYLKLEEHFSTIEEKTSSHAYDENAASQSLIEALGKRLKAYVAQFTTSQQGRKTYEEKLKALSNKIWKENYEQLESRLKAFQSNDNMPSAQYWTWPEATVNQAINERKQTFESLLQLVKNHRRYRKQVMAVQDSPISKADFEKLSHKIQTRMKSGNVKGFILVGASLLIVALAVWQAPALMGYFNEEKVWEQTLQADTWTGYQQYIKSYPEGKYKPLAKERQLLLAYGTIENIITDEGKVYTYEGELDGGKAHGQGIATFSNGDKYEGGWKAGQFWGQGTLTYEEGGSYAGEYEANRFHGSGTLKKANGDTYTGSWRQGLQDGQGSMLFADGSKYLGSWQAGFPHGNGTFSAGEEGIREIFERNWAANQSYSGDWARGKPNGTGTMRYGEGQMYQGNWKAGMRHGKGKLNLPGNSHFNGIWQADTLYGEGVFMSRFREETRGFWKGSLHQVKLLDRFGLLTKEGKFENGLFVSEK